MVLPERFIDELRERFALPAHVAVKPDTNFLELIGDAGEEQLRAMQRLLAFQMHMREEHAAVFFEHGLHHRNPQETVGLQTDIEFGAPGTVQRLYAMFQWCHREGLPDNGST